MTPFQLNRLRVSNGRMTENDEFERIWKEMVVVCFKEFY
jgi:hypothetical protein